jgi:hypothetical protein
MARLDDKRRYLQALVDMGESGAARRMTIAAGEVMSGRWLRYTPRMFLVDKRIDPSRIWRKRD